PHCFGAACECCPEQAANRGAVADVIEPVQRVAFPWGKMGNDLGHDGWPRRTVREDDERASILERTDREGGERPIVAPMKERARSRLQSPAQPPGNSGGDALGTRPEALDATVLDVNVRR